MLNFEISYYKVNCNHVNYGFEADTVQEAKEIFVEWKNENKHIQDKYQLLQVDGNNKKVIC